MKFNKTIIFVLCFIFSLSHVYAQDLTEHKTGNKLKQEEAERPQRKVKNRKDALSIARQYLKEQGMQMDYHLIGHMTKPLVKLKGNVWQVVFLKKKKDRRTLDTQSIRIQIDKDTGQVLEAKEQEGFYMDRPFR